MATSLLNSSYFLVRCEKVILIIVMPKSKVTDVVKKVLPAVVSITVSKDLKKMKSLFRSMDMGELFDAKRKKKVKIGGGSGFVVDKSGVILTNRHVVAAPNAEYIALLNSDKEVKAEVIGRDRINDVAVLKIEEEDLPTIELGDSSNLELGETVVAIGNALGRFKNTISKGIVSGLSREIEAVSSLDQKTQRLKGLIQTDAAVNPGNSGGPLVGLDGKAVGINAAMVHGAENISFALPVNSAKRDLEDIKEYGRIRQPFLGVRYIPLNRKLQQHYNLPVGHGALVISQGGAEEPAVVPQSPADKAGIQEGDIILQCQNEEVEPKQPLTEILQNYDIDQEVELKVLRAGKEKKMEVVLEEKK